MTQITPEMRQAAFEACAGATGRMVDAIFTAAYPLIRAQVLEDFVQRAQKIANSPLGVVTDGSPEGITITQLVWDIRNKERGETLSKARDLMSKKEG